MVGGCVHALADTDLRNRWWVELVGWGGSVELSTTSINPDP